MTSESLAVRDRLNAALIPAVPTLFTTDRTIDVGSLHRYIGRMKQEAFEGVAVWVHTGRGLFLSLEERALVLSAWREAFSDKLIIAGAGGSPTATTDEEYLASALAMATHANDLGADALLLYAPVRFRELERKEQEENIFQYHEAIAQLGLPVILFYLYEAAGGISYSPALIERLLTLPNVVGMKVATLDSVMTYQDIAAVFRKYPDHLLITGEDRFLGYSLMMGAQAALIGMGAICTTLQHDLLQAWFTRDLIRFHELSAQIDALAEASFFAPMEGYIGRILHGLTALGIISSDAAHDPFGPGLSEQERTHIAEVVVALSQRAY